ncbi:MAG: leucine-rich repeat domain-containing protein [Pseudomonadota bacterium]
MADDYFPSEEARLAYEQAERLIEGRFRTAETSDLLDFATMELTQLPPRISRLKGLKGLSLAATPIEDISPLRHLQNLQTLDVMSTNVTELGPIRELRNLLTLKIGATDVSDLEPLSMMRGMAAWALRETSDSHIGLEFLGCFNLPARFQDLSLIADDKARTLAALNQIRKDAGLSSVEEWLAEDETARPPEKPSIPEQTGGISFERTESGRIGLASSGLPDPSDIDELEGIRPTLIAAVDSLEAACEGSNAFQHIKSVATRYRAALKEDTTQLSIDRLVAEGTWLENANSRLQAEIASGDLPEQGTAIGAAMDTVIALHGMSVMGTKRGRELIQRHLDYQMDIADIQEARARTSEFAEQVKEHSELFEPEVGEIIERASNEIDEGPHPERSTDTARTTQSNILRVLGITAMSGAVWPVVSSGVSASEIGIAASAQVTLTMDLARAFWLSNQTIILRMAAAWGTDLNWVEALFRWLKKQ